MNLEQQLDEEINRVKKIVESSEIKDSEDFNIRGELYRLAFEVAPTARQEDITYMREWIAPKKGEISIDVAAGTGFLTKHLAKWTENTVYAVDPSDIQLLNLEKVCVDLPVKTVLGSLSEESVAKLIPDQVDLITSFGGIHHIAKADEQKKMFDNAAKLLKRGGRLVAADVGEGTVLALHFEKSVKKHCLTSHAECWLSEKRLQKELSGKNGLKLVKSEIVPIKWVFDSKHQLAIFMKGLHAYAMPEKEIVADLKSFLDFEERSGKVYLNWPMLFFHMIKM